MNKRIVAILLLTVLTVPVFTVSLYLHFEKSVVRHEVKWKMIAGLNPEELVLLKFTSSESRTKLRWEHSKEFEYRGQMYDIVYTEIKGDSVFYRCWWDHKETQLNQRLKILVAKALDKDQNNGDALLNLHFFLGTFFYSKPVDLQFIPYLKIAMDYQDQIQVPSFNSLLISPPKPPPKIG